jgi:oligopeptide/dipeptide ABC transporter ATP-binding protein
VSENAFQTLGSETPIVEVRGLSKTYRLRRSGLRGGRRLIRAVDDVSFCVERGTTFGLVGESGCGKSTLGRLLLRLENPTSGDVRFDGAPWISKKGEELRRERKNIQAVFQDPLASLDPKKKVIVSLGEALEAHGLVSSKEERRERCIQLLESVGLSANIGERFPQQLSGGQCQRVTIARAIAVGPKFLVCDEAVSALDVSVQAQVVNLLGELQASLNISYLFISHGLATVRHIADEIGVMYLGRLVERAPVDTLFNNAAHPYTRALLASVPVPDPTERRRGVALAGEVLSATDLPSGCRFRLRCPRAESICAQVEPTLDAHGTNHLVACHFPESSPQLSLPIRRERSALAAATSFDEASVWGADGHSRASEHTLLPAQQGGRYDVDGIE